ncbi:MAG: PDZ domain-containing protein [Planctomycetota bacterium]
MRENRTLGRLQITALAGLLGALFATTAMTQPLDEAIADQFRWREIGPTVFGGRIVDIELIPTDPSSFLVASASGGLFRTRNNGTSWEILFDDQPTISIGDIAIDPKDENVIWVGSGESNNQRSSYWGDGIYKTTDGGETWKNVGLKDSHHVGRIVVDPRDSNVVWVAALGHLYTPNEERGLYKTTDGGETWKKVLDLGSEVGVVDVALDPNAPDTVFAASYERLRRAWNFDGAGPGSGIHRSKDGGQTWQKLEGGLPTGEIGRIGIEVSRTTPGRVYATVSNQNPAPRRRRGGDEPRLGFWGEFGDEGFELTTVRRNSNAARAGLEVGDVILTIDGIAVTSVWTLLKALDEEKIGETVTITYRRGEESRGARMVLGEQPERERGEGPDIGGEIYRSDDGGDTWEKRNNRAVGGTPAYYYGQIRIDPQDDERLYLLSVPLYTSSDGGKTWETIARSLHVDHHAFAIDPNNPKRLFLGNDGGLGISYDRGESWDHYNNMPLAQFYAVSVDYQVPYHVYGGTQDNGSWGGPSSSRDPQGISVNEWYRVGGGDGFYTIADPVDPNTVYGESQFGAIYRLDRESGNSESIRPRPPEGESYRFNWNSPIHISHHNPQIIYFGGNRLFKSFNRGDTWPIISPDLTTANEEKIKGNVPHCTITTIGESKLDPNLLLVGTDDGHVQLSTDGALTWTNLAGRFDGVPANWWVNRCEFSPHVRDRAYVVFTGYREDDFRAFAYRTDDLGKTWKSITMGLPQEPVNVVREDPRNPNVLWLGTELGAYVSLDGGESWTELDSGLPTISVYDLTVHPRDRDVVIGTHGRGFFVLDAGPLQEITGEILAKKAHLFEVENAYALRRRSSDNFSGDRVYHGENAAPVTLSYWLSADVPDESISLFIEDSSGRNVRSFDLDAQKGLHRVEWDLRPSGGRRRRGGSLSPGRYTAVLQIGEDEQEKSFQILPDPEYSDPRIDATSGDEPATEAGGEEESEGYRDGREIID